jgi:enoyl-CoA hydratase
LGLTNKVVESADLLNEAKALLKKICSKSPSAVNKVIKCVNDYFRPNVNGMQREIYEFGEAFETPDFQEGTDAFLNKRKPNFRAE